MSRILTRRQFVARTASSSLAFSMGGGVLGALMRSAAASSDDLEPHFFLEIYTPGGADCSYMFDARPLAMTAAGKIQNYLQAEPTAWTGTNGQSTWATSLVDVLAPYKDRFSILNGVHMSNSFDGHDQNCNVLLTGSAFGGDSFIPHLNRLSGPHYPLDSLQRGTIRAALQNVQDSVPLSAPSARSIVSKLATQAPLQADQSLFGFMKSRFDANASGVGLLNRGSAKASAAMLGTPQLSTLLKKIQIAPTAVDDDPGFVDLMAQSFKLGVARSAFLSIGLQNGVNFDVHDPASAKQQPARFQEYLGRVAAIFKLLRDTPFDDQRSLWDVTTVMVCTEFSRTMRQGALPIDATGSDHNPLGNTVLLGGRGIRAGLVLGETDFRTADETLSGAHLAQGSGSVKCIGRPFDFDRLQPRTDLPATYVASDYLSIHSIVNTLYKLFNVPQATYRAVERNGPVARSLDGLLV